MPSPWVIVALGAVAVIPTLCSLIEQYNALCPEGSLQSYWRSTPPAWIENEKCMTQEELDILKSFLD